MTLRRKDAGTGPTTTAAGSHLSGGAFTAHQRDTDDVTLATTTAPACFTDISPTVPEDVRRLADVLAAIHATTTNRRAMWMADETFTCDGGALATKLAADRLGIDATLHVGLYWHTDVELRADIMGYELDDDGTQEEWDAVFDEVRQSMDEHHHWVTVRGSDGAEYLIDPNGPVREEPHIMPVEQATAYEDGAPYFAYDPREGPNVIADEMYPGLREQVHAAIGGQIHPRQS